MWRLGSWGVAAVGAVALAVVVNRYQLELRHDQFAAADTLARQARQLQQLTNEAKVENRRLSHAIDTLNSDRDRLFTRVTSLEQGLASVTGSIKRDASAKAAPEQPGPSSASALPDPTPPPAPMLPAPSATSNIPAVTSAAATPPIEPAAASALDIKPVDTAEASAAATAAPKAQEPDIGAAPPVVPPPSVAMAAADPGPPEAQPSESKSSEIMATPVPRTEFGVDIGGANSVDGLRSIWRSLSKSHQLAGLHPIIVVKERSNGLGMQLRLVAGPLTDAAAAARICAGLAESKRSCETSIFDGQRLALKNDAVQGPAATPAPKPPRAAQHKRAVPKPAPAPAPKPEQRAEQPLPRPVEEAQAPAPKPAPSLSTLLGFNREQSQ